MIRIAALLLRADADVHIGLGRLTRLLSLCAAWRTRGGRVLFLGSVASPAVQEQIRQAGAEFYPLGRRHPHPDDLATVGRHIARMREEVGPQGAVWTAVDGHYFDAEYQSAIQAFGSRLLIVDDLAAANHYDADLILNQMSGIDERQYSGCVGSDTTLLLGTRYALLRPQFARYRPLRAAVPEITRRVLIAFDGADSLDLTSKALAAIQQVSISRLHARVLVGASNRNTAFLRAWARQHPGQVELLLDSPNWAAEMASADLALAAAGDVCWELACMQTPALVTATSPDQVPIARCMARAGAMIDLGPAEGITVMCLAAAVKKLCLDPETRTRQIEAARGLIDGAGAARVTAVMRALDGELTTEDVVLRPLEPTDCWPLWRTKPGLSLHANAHATDPIPPDEHRRWFGEKLASEAVRIWVLVLHGLILGVIRYDRVDDTTAEISFHVVRSCRRRGLGTRLVTETCDWARKELSVARLRAVVHTNNGASARVFLGNGFDEVAHCVAQGQDCRILEQTRADIDAGSATFRLPKPTVVSAAVLAAPLPAMPAVPISYVECGQFD